MAMIRRLVSLCLVLAFASYGAIAAAPHTHDGHDGQGAALHAIAVDLGDSDADHHDHDVAGEAAPGDHSAGDHEDSSPAHGGFHAHAVAAFTVTDAIPEMAAPVAVAEAKRIDRVSVHASGLFSPLKKPPRILL